MGVEKGIFACFRLRDFFLGQVVFILFFLNKVVIGVTIFQSFKFMFHVEGK